MEKHTRKEIEIPKAQKQQTTTQSNDSDDDENSIGPQPPKQNTSNQEENNDTTKKTEGGVRNYMDGADDSDDSEEERENEHTGFEEQDQQEQEQQSQHRIPTSHEVVLKGHTRSISALSLDPGGGRLISGGYDYNVNIYDFGGMDSGMRAFRTIEPFPGNHVISLQFSLTGDRFLITTGDNRAAVFNREGKELDRTNRGDMYILDMAQTKGHVAALGNGQWHPTDQNTFMTCSLDGTVRLWNAETMKQSQKLVIKFKDRTNKKIGVTRCLFTTEGSAVIGATQDGSIQMWPVKGPFVKPKIQIQNAHMGEISSLAISDDGFTLLSRSVDDTLKVWDLRNAGNTPLHVFSELPTFGDCQTLFSPNDELIVTGTALTKKQKATEAGLVLFWDKKTFQPVKRLGISNGAGVTSLQWHPRINQLFVGTTNSEIHALFDPNLSRNGALLCATKIPRQTNELDFELDGPIITPFALRMYKEKPMQKRKKERDALNPQQRSNVTLLPEIKEGEKGRMGKVGSGTSGMLLRQYFPMKMNPLAAQADPRDELLKYQNVDADPKFFGVYKQNQPVAIFDYTSPLETEVQLTLKEKIEKERKNANRRGASQNYE